MFLKVIKCRFFIDDKFKSINGEGIFLKKENLKLLMTSLPGFYFLNALIKKNFKIKKNLKKFLGTKYTINSTMAVFEKIDSS